MSLLTRGGRITVKAFAAVPALADLPEIQQDTDSVSDTMSTFEGADSIVNLAEGCFLTKSLKYTHQLAQWVNYPRSRDPAKLERFIVRELEIIPYEDFNLNDPFNLTYLEGFVQMSLDTYAFIGFTASSSTLCDLIEMLKVDNNRRQQEFDKTGHDPYREINFDSPSFTDPEYELVAMHPEHFLPCARDRCLRESVEPDSRRLPPFRHDNTKRDGCWLVNPFLVILNAEIKFHRYLRMISRNPPKIPLPADVLNLMHLTIELVDLLYWKPVRTNDPETAEAMETRKAYGRSLMSGNDCYYDPTNMISNSDSTKQSSEIVDLEEWRQSVD